MSRQTDGSPRVRAALAKRGIRCGRHRVAKLMKKANLMSKVKRRFKVTKDSKHKLPVAENLLNREFKVKEPNKVWVQDIPYIWTKEDFMYLVVVIDLFSRKVGRWSMLDNMRKALVIDVLDMSFNARIPEPELMVHSGIGS